MSFGQTVKELLAKIMAFFKGFGKKRSDDAVRQKAGDDETEQVTTLSNEMQSDKLARLASQKAGGAMAPVVSKDQWSKLKKSAKELDPAESSLEHWNPSKNTLLSGTTFDAATTDVSNSRARKRPTVVTQARITSNRLQALQARLDKPKNDFDSAHQDDDDGPGPMH